MKLKPYPEYKDSGIPWVGLIPDHWVVNRAKWYMKSIKDINKEGQCKQVLSLTLRGVVDNNPDDPEGLVPKDYRTYQIFEKNDLVFKLIDLENIYTSRVGLVHKKGIMSPAYIRAVVGNYNKPLFFYYLYYAWYLQNVFNKLGAGVRATLSSKDLLNLRIVLPPIEEQRKIVKYIIMKEKKIIIFIRKKQRMIQILKEQKKVIINQAVTKGINPNVTMKPSGIDWIGDIPEHWEIGKLRHLLKPISKRNCPELPLLSVERERGIVIRNTNNIEKNHNFIPDDLTNYKVVECGQFVINKMKSWQGSYGISKYNGIVSPAYYIFNIDDNLFKKFFHYAIRSKSYISFFGRASDGVRIGQWDLSINRMKEIPFLIPKFSEQKSISNYIERKIKNIDSSIFHFKQEIKLIQEYRTRLIFDVVTGKIDVRGIEIEDIPDEELIDEIATTEEPEVLEESSQEVSNAS